MFRKLFSHKSPGPDIRFGRHGDTHKSPEQQAAWGLAVEAFQAGSGGKALEYLLQYLRDEHAENVIWETRPAEKIVFVLLQGSQRIEGTWDPLIGLRAKAEVAKLEGPVPGLSKLLLSTNMALRYCHYALGADDVLCLRAESSVGEAYPHKIYQTLRELALTADKADDILAHNFPNVRFLGNAPITEASPVETGAKQFWLRAWVENALSEAAKPPANAYPQAITYLLLGTAYKIDYLLAPEGPLRDSIDQIDDCFAENPLQPLAERQQGMTALLQAILREKHTHWYRSAHTFGLRQPAAHERLSAIIGEEMALAEWFLHQNLPELACSAAEYAVGHCLYHYTAPPPVEAMFDLLFRVTCPEYYRDLGFRHRFADNSGNPRETAIRQSLKEIGARYHETFPFFAPLTAPLLYTSTAHFALSLLHFIKNADLRQPNL